MIPPPASRAWAHYGHLLLAPICRRYLIEWQSSLNRARRGRDLRGTPTIVRLPSARSSSASVARNRVLPMPAGPLTITTPGRLSGSRRTAAIAELRSSSRPTSRSLVSRTQLGTSPIIGGQLRGRTSPAAVAASATSSRRDTPHVAALRPHRAMPDAASATARRTADPRLRLA